MCVDLHIHSIYSDGTAYPSELIKIAVNSGLKAISLTDHDTVDGTDEIIDHGNKNNIQVVAGLEVSTTHNQYSLHILGYGIDHNHPELQEWLTRIQEGRISRNNQIITKLQQLGLTITNDELQILSRTGQAGRPHIARLLMDKGIVNNIQDAFKLYLRKGAPAWASRFAYSAADAINMIHRAGGIAVLAHPGQIAPEVNFLPLLIRQLVECGLDGLEIYYPGYSSTVQHNLRKLARKFNLIVTGGSDYHGANKPYAQMASEKNGFCPPDDILDHIYEKMNALQKCTG